MFAVFRICRVLTGQNLVPQHFSIAHYRSEGISEMSRFVGTKVEFGADTDRLPSTPTHVSCRLFILIAISMTFF